MWVNEDVVGVTEDEVIEELWVRMALERLVESDRAIVLLYADGMSVRRIARRCGISVSEARERLERALDALREMLRVE